MFSDLEFKTYRKYNYHTEESTEYLNIESSFDIETTSTMVNDEKMAFMYLWGFGIGNNENHLYYGRTWEELKLFLNNLSNELNLHKNRLLVVYVHNLAYEFQFMRKHFEWLEVFSVGDRKPVKAISTLGIEFRDSYILSGFSLEYTANNLQKHDTKKLIGDLDYSLVRHAETPISPSELDYLKNDIVIVMNYINEQLDIYEKITKIPMTNTGRVREFVRNHCYYSKGKSKYRSSKGKRRNYREIMELLTLGKDEYIKLKATFMGGFTHANAYYTNKVVENVHSVDFTSSYPAVILTEQFPMGKGFTPSTDDILKNGYDYYLENFNCMVGVKFTNLKNKFHHDSYLSESKCRIRGEKLIDNGRVNKADELATIFTELDLWIVKQVYSYDSLEIKDLTCYPKGYLPKAIVESTLELYQDKTELKGVEGSEIEYNLSKGMLNSIYGMMVTDIVQDDIVYDNMEGWGVEEVNESEEIEKYNEQMSRFLYYPWGVWVTAYARRNLWLGILRFQEDYIYSDTDSIKFLNYEKHESFLTEYNEWVEQKQKDLLNYYKLDLDLLYPKTIEGEVKIAGVWDYEGNYSRFKTLGAKRYLVEENNELYLTVAGLSKRNGIEYMKEISGYDNTKVFDLFDDELKIPSNRTGKSTHTYIDSVKKSEIVDYVGNVATVESLSSVHLENADYSLSMSDFYVDFYKLLQKGFLFKGVLK